MMFLHLILVYKTSFIVFTDKIPKITTFREAYMKSYLDFFIDFRGGISVVTETGQITQSHLVIRNARQTDEGNYTCKPSIFKSASLRLFVIDGKDLILGKVDFIKYLTCFQISTWNQYNRI